MIHKLDDNTFTTMVYSIIEKMKWKLNFDTFKEEFLDKHRENVDLNNTVERNRYFNDYKKQLVDDILKHYERDESSSAYHYLKQTDDKMFALYLLLAGDITCNQLFDHTE